MYKNNYPHKRYRITLEFLKKYIDKNEEILDLGVSNPFSEIMKENNYNVSNTHGEDLDIELSSVHKSNATTVTAFEIFEHLVAPFNVLKEINIYIYSTTMDLNQSKLTRAEWETIEKPVSSNEKIVLDLIIKGYDDVDLKYNNTKTFLTFTKMESSPSLEYFIFKTSVSYTHLTLPTTPYV